MTGEASERGKRIGHGAPVDRASVAPVASGGDGGERALTERLCERLVAISRRELYDRTLTPGEAGEILDALAAAEATAERRGELLAEWLSYTGLRSRAFDPALDPDDDEYASGRSLVRRTDAVLVGGEAGTSHRPEQSSTHCRYCGAHPNNWHRPCSRAVLAGGGEEAAPE